MNVTEIEVTKLLENAKNPNRMDPDQLVMLTSAIQRIGFLQPILVRKIGETYTIIDGHHRYRAAIEAGMTTVPCVIAHESMTDSDATAAMLGLNRIRGEIDLARAAGFMVDLTINGWSIDDLAVTGFTTSEIEDLLASGQQDMDDIMDQPSSTPDEDEQLASPRPFVLEITFSSREEYTKARKGLKRAAGKGGELSAGLLRLLGE